jgi:uncharacterized membrane protein
MKNKHVGYTIIGIAAIVIFIIISYDKALVDIVNTSCSHGTACPMNAIIDTQRIISIAIAALLLVGGLAMIFFVKEKEVVKEIVREKVEYKEGKKPKKKEDLKLDKEEERIYDLLVAKENSMYQSDLVKETKLTKVKITRILDKMEAKKIIKRQRRGMTNIVFLD